MLLSYKIIVKQTQQNKLSCKQLVSLTNNKHCMHGLFIHVILAYIEHQLRGVDGVCEVHQSRHHRQLVYNEARLVGSDVQHSQIRNGECSSVCLCHRFVIFIERYHGKSP